VSLGAGIGHLESPEESRSSKALHTYRSYICTKRIYIYAGLRDEVYIDCFLFSFHICFLSQMKRSRCLRQEAV